jgi:D-3-phosphoglycerate dehydrogenase
MKVIITDHGFPHIDQERSLIEGAGGQFAVAQCKTVEDVISSCADAEILLVQWAPITAAVLDALPHCRLIVRYGIGVDNVDIAAATARGIPVCNVPDYCVDEVADHSLALALAIARQLQQTDYAVRGGNWKITPPRAFPAFRDTVFATAGFGRIARAVLQRARAFGFQVAAYDPFVPAAGFDGVRRLERDELFATAGILSLHLPLTADTRHFVGREQLARMLPTAVVVNTARGGLIDTAALAEALLARTIFGAGIDVFVTEPLPDNHPLRYAPHALLTSHTAWYSAGSVPELQRKAANEIVRALQGEPLTNPVNGIKALRR